MTQPAIRTVHFRPQERNVFFHLLTGCNLACRHCYINPDQHGRQMVDRETMGAWLKLFAAPERETNLILLGGEPTLHPDLAFGVKTARKLGYNSVTIDTNGYLFHDILEKITPDEAVLSFSLDGPSPEVNDPLRGAGVFAVCVANLKKAVARGFPVSVICTVSRMNLAHLEKMPQLLATLGVNRFFIQVIGLRGKSATPGNSLQASFTEWLEVVPKVAASAARLGIPTIFPKVFLDTGETFACAGRVAENYFIFPNGRVYRCPLCEDFPVHSLEIKGGLLVDRPGLNEDKFFQLDIPEGCVMNRLLQPGNIDYDTIGQPLHRVSCCLLKQEARPG